MRPNPRQQPTARITTVRRHKKFVANVRRGRKFVAKKWGQVLIYQL